MKLQASIGQALSAAGIPQPPQVVELLARDLAFVLEANKSINLTAIREPAQAVVLHVVDSLLALPEVDAAPSGPLVDLGAGAGFPGIPLAIVTKRPTTLVESVGKKARFLGELTAELGLGVDVIDARAERLALGMPGQFSVVVARALASLPSLVELAAPLLAEGGHFIAYKGEPDPDELARGDRVAVLVGLERISQRDVMLGEAVAAHRTLVAYRRVGKSKVRLPRRTGLAQNQALA